MHRAFANLPGPLSTGLLLAVAALPCRAQCALQTAPSLPPINGVTGPVFSSCMWDPDGPGPLPVRLVVGGDFQVAGSVATNGLAAYDLVTGQWSAFPGGPGMRVLTIVPLPNGELVVAGAQIGSTLTSVKKWDGSAWSQLGGTFSLAGQTAIEQMVALPNGDLVACGNFTVAGGVPAAHIARWDGTAWHALGTGLDARALALAALPNGDVVVGGELTTAGGVASPHAARWDGTQWHAMTASLFGWVTELIVRGNGEVVAGSGGDVLRWNGAAWVSLGPAPGFPIHAFAETSAGQLLVGGDTLGGVRVFDGTGWSVFMPPTGRIQYALTALPNGHVVVGGTIAYWLRRWTGANYQALGGGGTGVTAMTPTRDGGLVATGWFANGAQAELAARWNGASWQPLPGLYGFTSLNGGSAQAIAEAPGGQLVALLSVPTFGGPTWYTAVWNGGTWVVSFVGLAVTCLAKAPNGQLFGGTADGIAHWNGATWATHVGGFVGSVSRIAVLPDGSFVVSGSLDFGSGPGDRVARWDGVAWTVLADVWAGTLAVVDGQLVVGGQFASIGGVTAQNIARWDGAMWQPFGAGVQPRVHGIVQLPGGDVVAAHSYFTGAMSRWDGAQWTLIAVTDGSITTAAFGGGALFTGGTFTIMNGVPAVGYGRLVTPCPATIAAAGAGCAGSGGQNVLTVTAPWLGSTLLSETSGLVPNSIALALWGVSPASASLPQLLPVGLPGCTLWVLPVLLVPSVPTFNVATSSLPLPGSVALVGQSLLHQIVALEFALGGSFAAVSSSNAVQLTLGAF